MSTRIAHASLALPEPYIRKNVNGERVNMWTEQIKLAAEEKVRERPGTDQKAPVQFDATAVRAAWFLPAITVMALAKPETIEFKGKDGKKQTKTVGYRIIDGVHRYLTSMQVGLTEIDADVKPPMTPAQAYALQFKLNNEGPLPFDREARDNAIRQMAKFKKADGKAEMTMENIAAQTGLTKGQVSRIVAGKSGLARTEVSARRKKAAKKRGAKAKGGYDAAEFFAGIKVAAREAKAHVKVLGEYLAEHEAFWEYCFALQGCFTEIREAAKAANKATKEK